MLGQRNGLDLCDRGTLGPSNKVTGKGASALPMQFPDPSAAGRLVLS